MVTEEFDIPGFEFPVRVTHEEDWSGMVQLEWIDASSSRQRLVEIPAGILLHLSINQTKSWVLAEVEHAIDKLKGDPNE